MLSTVLDREAAQISQKDVTPPPLRNLGKREKPDDMLVSSVNDTR